MWRDTPRELPTVPKVLAGFPCWESKIQDDSKRTWKTTTTTTTTTTTKKKTERKRSFGWFSLANFKLSGSKLCHHCVREKTTIIGNLGGDIKPPLNFVLACLDKIDWCSWNSTTVISKMKSSEKAEFCLRKWHPGISCVRLPTTSADIQMMSVSV